jgi:hypothetical protein
MLPQVSSAVTISSMMCLAHIATRRVEMGLPPTIWAAWARNRLRTAAQRLAQMRPAAMRPVGEVVDVDVVQLAAERKHLTNVLKMIAYQAESDLVRRITPH